MCGDRIDVFVKVKDGVIEDISFQGKGCAISKASASLMSSIVKGKPVEEAEKLFAKFKDLITGKLGENPDLEEIGKLAVLAGVKEFPARVKCASLAWHTMINAINEEKNLVTTE